MDLIHLYSSRLKVPYRSVSNFKLQPYKNQRDGKIQLLEVSVDGYVSLDANKKVAIWPHNATLYRFKDDIFTLDTLENILKAYKKDLNAQEAFKT